jgi:hypothetical protein
LLVFGNINSVYLVFIRNGDPELGVSDKLKFFCLVPQVAQVQEKAAGRNNGDENNRPQITVT